MLLVVKLVVLSLPFRRHVGAGGQDRADRCLVSVPGRPLIDAAWRKDLLEDRALAPSLQVEA